MRAAPIAAGIALAVAALYGPALAAEIDPAAIADRAFDAWGVSHPWVQMTALVVAGALYAWRMWLTRPQPAHHTTDELFALLNSLSERVDALAVRMDQHVDSGACRPD